MLQVRSPVLYFSLLVLGVFFDFTADVVNKRGRFSKTLSKGGLEFVSSERSNPVPLNLNLVLLPAEVDPILEERGRKGDALVARGTGRVKIIFTLLAKIVTLYV